MSEKLRLKRTLTLLLIGAMSMAPLQVFSQNKKDPSQNGEGLSQYENDQAQKEDRSKKKKKSISYEEVRDQPDFGRFKYLEIKGHSGYHLYGGTSLKENVEGGYGALELRYAWQSKDSTSWESYYSYPSYGVGYYSGFIGDPDVLGKPNAIFGFINFPLSRYHNRNVWEITPSFGVTYNLEPFNAESNPTNDAIGSDFAVYFGFSFGAAYKLNREIDLIYGIDFTHFSVGRITTPNHGLNMYGLNLAMRYHYNADQRFVDKDPYSKNLLQARFQRPERRVKPKLNENLIEIYLAGGAVQNLEDQGTNNRYAIFAGLVEYRHRFNMMHGLTLGLDYFYDESLKQFYDDQDLLAVHAGYDFMFGRLTARAQVGTYLEDDKGKDPIFYRAALRYDITKWLFAQIGIKTRETFRADWVEWGLGFTPFRW